MRPAPDGNVEILGKFWGFESAPPELAPPLLIYADLLATGDARCLEAARRWRDDSLIDLQDKEDLRALGDLVRDLRDHSAGADFMLIGAAARDLLLQHHHGVEPLRKTTDVDFAFALSDWPAYIALTRRLIDTGGFKPDERTQHRLRNRIGTLVDLLPFGGVESREAQIVWPPPGDTLMSVIGYAEANAATESVILPGAVPLAVITIPMFALLKLFAWDDRHWAQPRKDASDLLFVLDHAFRWLDLNAYTRSRRSCSIWMTSIPTWRAPG